MRVSKGRARIWLSARVPAQINLIRSVDMKLKAVEFV